MSLWHYLYLYQEYGTSFGHLGPPSLKSTHSGCCGFSFAYFDKMPGSKECSVSRTTRSSVRFMVSGAPVSNTTRRKKGEDQRPRRTPETPGQSEEGTQVRNKQDPLLLCTQCICASSWSKPSFCFTRRPEGFYILIEAASTVAVCSTPGFNIIPRCFWGHRWRWIPSTAYATGHFLYYWWIRYIV